MNGLGILLPFRACRSDDAVSLGTEAEELGYSAVWVPEVSTFDAISVVAALSRTTEKIRLGTAIVAIDTRTPVSLAMSAATLADLAPGRITIGIGVSTKTIIESWHGRSFAHPAERARDTLTILDQVLGGEVTGYKAGSLKSNGFRLDIAPEARPDIYLAALGPVMRKLAMELADGLILNFLPRSKGSQIAAQLSQGSTHIDKTAFVRVALDGGEDEIEARIRREMASYLRIEQYRNWLLSLGLDDSLFSGGEDLDSIATRLPAEFVDDIAIMGDANRCKAKLDQLKKSGIDPIVVPSIAAGDLEGFRRVMRALVK